MSELPATLDNAVELLRVWLADDTLVCSLDPAVFEEPAGWGEVLAYLVRHIAETLGENDGPDPATTIAAIRSTFEKELAPPPEGQT